MRAGLSKEGRTRVYSTVVRPTLEYDTETCIPGRALCAIYPGYHYEDILRVTGLQTLAQKEGPVMSRIFQ